MYLQLQQERNLWEPFAAESFQPDCLQILIEVSMFLSASCFFGVWRSFTCGHHLAPKTIHPWYLKFLHLSRLV